MPSITNRTTRHSPELSGRDESVSILVKDLEGLLDLLFAVGVSDLSAHHGQELGKIDLAVSVSIDLRAIMTKRDASDVRWIWCGDDPAEMSGRCEGDDWATNDSGGMSVS